MISGFQTVRDSAIALTLRVLAAKPAVANAAWHIDPEELADVTIRWPQTYQWPQARIWIDSLISGFKARARVAVTELEQPYPGIVLFEFGKSNRRMSVVIDYSDYPEINLQAADQCEVYFKMQHLREGYGRANVLPGGYVCDARRLYLHLERLRQLRDRRAFKFDVYGRFSTEFAYEVRSKAFDLLAMQNAFQFEGGLRKVKYLDFLKELAQAKVCIDLPGQGDFCFRLINYLAIGACIVGPRPRTVLHMPLRDRVHIAYTKDDFSDLVDVCRFYLEDDRAREEMCRESRRFFEAYLHKDNLTSYYLRCCLDRLN